MIRGRCPICGKSFETPSMDAHPGFPFCSDRCKLIDLGRWIDGSYSVPEKVVEPPPEPDAPADVEEE